MYQRLILLSIVLFMSHTASAEDVDITLGNESARLMYIREAFGQEFGQLEMEVGFLYTEDESYLANIGLLVRGESVNVPMTVSLGARAYVARLRSYNVGALAIGGDLYFSPETWGGVGVGANYYLAPKIVSFVDAEDLSEYSLYVSYQITQQAKVSVGYRAIDVRIKDGLGETSADDVGNIGLDGGLFFGLNLVF